MFLEQPGIEPEFFGREPNILPLNYNPGYNYDGLILLKIKILTDAH